MRKKKDLLPVVATSLEFVPESPHNSRLVRHSKVDTRDHEDLPISLGIGGNKGLGSTETHKTRGRFCP